MDRKLSTKQEKAYRLVSGEFDGLPVKVAAVLMDITPQAVNRLLDRARTACPQLFPLLTKQEVDVNVLRDMGWDNGDIANKLQVSEGRVSQIVKSYCDKRRTATTFVGIKTIAYQPYMDSQIRRKF